MRIHLQLLTLSSLTLILLITGCSSSNKGIRITEGQQEPHVAAPMVPRSTTPIVVHIDLFERIATVRNGMSLGNQFLITTDFAGTETAVLKARASSLSETLLTADILEGAPKINNIVKTADAARSIELAKTYRAVGE